MEKNDTQISRFAVVKKAPSPERTFFEKKNSGDIKLQVIFWFQKIVLHHKIISKTWSTKNQENSAHCFGDNYLTNHLVKFLQDRIKP